MFPNVMIAAKQGARFDSVAQLLSHAKAHPGKAQFRRAERPRRPPHAGAGVQGADRRPTSVVVPYKGASNAITDMLGGQIDGGFETTSVVFGPSRRGTPSRRWR